MGSARGPLLIVGASTRAAAESAARAGFEVFAVDAFGDWDLRQVARVAVPGDWCDDDAIACAAASFPEGPWLYTGAVENRPDLIDRISRERRLLGNSAEVVRRVRDPMVLAEVLRHEGFEPPEVRDSLEGLPRDGSWLAKPLRSAGGIGIREVGDDLVDQPTGSTYYQRRIEGQPCSALYLGTTHETILVGVTKSEVGAPDQPFAYAGSLRSNWIAWHQDPGLRRLGESLGRHFGLGGLFGVDLIHRFEAGRDRFYPVEVNPRPTASVELHEAACDLNLLTAHVEACVSRRLPSLPPPRECYQFKDVIYARGLVTIPTGWDWSSVPRDAVVLWDRLGFSRIDPIRVNDPLYHRVADLPVPGSTIPRGQPVLSILVDADEPLVAIQSHLSGRAAWEHIIDAWTAGNDSARTRGLGFA